MSNDSPCFVGIDVGKGGAIAIVNKNGVVASYAMPTLPDGNVDALKLYSMLVSMHHVKMVIIEQVHAIFGASAGSTFEFGKSAGIVSGVVCASRLPYTMTPPKVWQKEMWKGISKVIKDGKKKVDTKATSLVAVRRLFPEVELHDKSKPKSKKIHDGIVDAILLAEYGRRLWNGLNE